MGFSRIILIYTEFKMKKTISLLMAFSLPVCATNFTPSSTVDSEVFPAANFCGMEAHSKEPVAYPYQAGYQVTEGYMMACSLPFKSGRYIERIVLDFVINGMSPRSCKVGFTRASSGATVRNTMTLDTSGGIKVFHYENLGAETIYQSGYINNALLLRCEHWSFTGSSYVRYGSIRVDYTQQN